MSRAREFIDFCFQGSSRFYDGMLTDELAPTSFEAGYLNNNLTTRKDGTVPPWIVEGSSDSPAQQFVEWFNAIWHTGDPRHYNEDIFSTGAVLIDPLEMSRGASEAADSFRLLFKCFPDLRGEVMSWAANDREIFINWRFMLVPPGRKTPFLVPVVDKFGVDNGRISWRLAHFDIITLLGYLSRVYGLDNLIDFLLEKVWQAQKTGGVIFLPRVLWNLMSGLFRWPHSPPAIELTAIPGDGVVMLSWKELDGAVSYKVTRATALAGPYETPSSDGKDIVVAASVHSYEDRNVKNGMVYWYVVKPNLTDWLEKPFGKSAAVARSNHKVVSGVRAYSTEQVHQRLSSSRGGSR